MTKKEALEFLELPESATDVEIKIRMADKLSYFEELSEKAPSDFLRRLHGKNVAKIKKIQEESAEWISPESRSEVILPFEPDTDEKLADENDLPATTIIISSGSKASRQKQTAAISALFIFVNSAAGLGGQVTKGISFSNDMYIYVAIAFTGGICGAYFGALKFKQSILSHVLALVLLVAAWKLLFTQA